MMNKVCRTSAGHHEELLFTNESDRKNIGKYNRISFQDFVLLQIDIIKDKYIFGLNDERDFPSVIEILVIANMNFLNLYWQIGYVWL